VKILKKQQEDEYEQSRQADLAKERARQEEQDTNERLKQQRLQQQQESKARLPQEPNETEKNITRLKKFVYPMKAYLSDGFELMINFKFYLII